MTEAEWGTIIQGRMLRRFFMLVLETDPTATKVTLAIGAILSALGYWIDVTCPYVDCAFLEQAAPWPIWAVAWSVYAVALIWRTLEGVHRPHIALVVNVLGVLLYGAVAVGSVLARWPHFSLSAFNIALACAAVWVLARTHVNPGYGFRGD